jgi:CrcB protein
MIPLGIAIFASLGALCRYGIDLLLPTPSAQAFPWHTFIVNMLGSFVIGAIYVLASEKSIINDSWRVILTTGLLGSFTTFSAFSLQNLILIQEGRIAMAAAYSASSWAVGITAVFLGVLAMRALGSS